MTPEGITVRELVSYGRSPWLPLWGRLSRDDHQHVNRAMAQTHTDALADRRRRSCPWRAAAARVSGDGVSAGYAIVLLDEPTTWLDINHQVELMALMQMLKQAGKTVVTVLHDLNQASRYCDHLVVLAQGNVIAQGQPVDVMQPELLRKVFQVDAEIHPEPLTGKPMCIIR